MVQIAAIFDLDETLLAEATPDLILRYLRRTGELWRYFSRRHVMVVAGVWLRHRMGWIDDATALQQTARIAAGIPVDEFWLLIDRWFREMVVHTITADGQVRLAWHRQQGHIPVLCSASSQFSVLPVARHLQIDQMVYTEWLSRDGRLTGEVELPIVYGQGKLHRMAQWATANDVDLSRSYAYGNHITDRYLLEAVAFPAAVNPDKKLEALAQANGWPIAWWTATPENADDAK